MAASTGLNQFSMRDEARNTASHFSTLALGANLRLRPVTFVSAGFARPLDDNAVGSLPEDAATAPYSVEKCEPDGLQPEVDLVSDPGDGIPAAAVDNNRAAVPVSLACREVSNGRISGDISDESEDIVLFRGRKWIAAQKASNTTKGGAPAHAQPVPGCGQGRVAFEMERAQTRRKDHGNEVVDDATRARWSPDGSHVNSLNDTSEESTRIPEDKSDKDSRDHGEDEEDEEAMVADVDDRTLARVFSGLEGRGIGFDEPDFSSDSAGHFEPATKLSQPEFLDASEPPYHPREDLAPNDEAVADALGELALTGAGRDILQHPRGARRSKQPPVFNASDSELESAMRSAWSNDRERKKNRKLMRESLRRQGLLGHDGNPGDLRIKYQDGMRLEDIKHELKGFLMGHEKTLQFPPMDKHARKMLHELAHKFAVKSKSVGTGDGRRPVLCRTKGTLVYSQELGEQAQRHIDEASLKIHRKFFGRMDKTDRSGKSKQDRSGHGAVTYRDGEIVGATAPQIGEGNKGHAMLEKMGWSNGMALGTADNKGILEPVAQVVKRSKAGLG